MSGRAEGRRYDTSVEFSYEEIRAIIKAVGMELLVRPRSSTRTGARTAAAACRRRARARARTRPTAGP